MQWLKIYYLFEDENSTDQFNLIFYGTAIAHALMFWSFNIGFLLIEYFQPKWALKYKVQESQPVSILVIL